MPDTTTTEPLSREFIVAAITSATNELFSTMLDLPIESGDSMAKDEVEASSGLVALIGLAGAWAGTGSIACTGALACTLATQLLGMPVEAVNEDVLDAVGEITNMILGNVKTMLEEKVGPMGLSTPTVIFGRNFQTRSARVHAWTLVPFNVNGEKLLVQLCVAPNEDRSETTLRHGFPMPHVLTV
jgi:chemotaxis protein CheX